MAITPTEAYLTLSDLKACSTLIAEALARSEANTGDTILNACLARAERYIATAGTFAGGGSQDIDLQLAALELATMFWVNQLPDSATAWFLPLVQEALGDYSVSYRDADSKAKEFADRLIAANLDADSIGIFVSGVDVFTETTQSPELTDIRLLVAPYPYLLPGTTQTRALEATDFQQLIRE